jgi:hypothetical protein
LERKREVAKKANRKWAISILICLAFCLGAWFKSPVAFVYLIAVLLSAIFCALFNLVLLWECSGKISKLAHNNPI